MLTLLGITPTLPTFVRTAGEIAICQCVLVAQVYVARRQNLAVLFKIVRWPPSPPHLEAVGLWFNMFTPKIRTLAGFRWF